MPDLTVPGRPVLVTIPDVELLQTGTWETSTGTFTWDHTDLVAAVAAQDDPAVRTPIIKLGHVDPRFDGQPTIGRVANLRVSANGQTLIGDLVGVPAWLADIIPTAFPSRSIEGVFDYGTANGMSHAFVLTGLALLGVNLPAIETLDDIAGLYGVAVSAPATGTPVAATFKEGAMPAQPAATVSTEDIRRIYYDGPGQGWAWWIREIHVDPTELIVENDDDGLLYRVPYAIAGDQVTFETATRVLIQYVDASRAVAAAAAGFPTPTSYASRADARPNDPRGNPAAADPPPAGEKGGTRMDATTLRTRLGLPEDATDEDVEAKLTELEDAATTPPPAPAPAPIELPEGVVAIDESTLDELKVAAARGNQAHETLRTQERDRFLDNAVNAGKFAPARREHFANLYDADEVGAKELVAKLAANTVPLAEVGHGQDGSPDATIAAQAEQFLAQLGHNVPTQEA